MATSTWVPAGGGSITFTGILEIRDMHLPYMSKDEWGVDTLFRTVRGPADLFDAYGDALDQGDTYDTDWKLQTWSPIEHPVFPGFNLNYKGLRSGTLPDELVEYERAELVSSISATGLSVSYDGKTITSATQEIKYIAPQATYRYITTSRPTTPTYNTVDTGVEVVSSVITMFFDDGTSQIMSGAGAPAGVVSALAATPAAFVIGPASIPILGTSYWENVEVVRLQYPGS